MTTKKETRGRKRRFDLETAVQEAQRQFHESGFEGTKMSDVCAALGITQTSLYAAYESKVGLYERVVDRYANSTAVFIAKALAVATTPEQLWDEILTGAAVSYGNPESPGCLVLGMDVSTQDAAARTILQKRVQLTEQAIEQRLSELNDPEASANARTLMTVLRGLSGAARAGAESDQLLRDVHYLLGRQP